MRADHGPPTAYQSEFDGRRKPDPSKWQSSGRRQGGRSAEEVAREQLNRQETLREPGGYIRDLELVKARWVIAQLGFGEIVQHIPRTPLRELS
jgi:hypothetical protein